jgi:ADP-L-glycero-D-manno-heptose 6-epimerase
MDVPVNIEFIDMPEALRGKYQYFTQAQMEKLRAAGYAKPFTPLEDAVSDYIRNYYRKQTLDEHGTPARHDAAIR